MNQLTRISQELSKGTVRSATTFAYWATRPDGTSFTADGIRYIVDSSVTGASSAGYEYGIDGIRPELFLGYIFPASAFGAVAGVATAPTYASNATLLQAAMDYATKIKGKCVIDGAYRYSTPLAFDKQMTVGGHGPIDGSSLIPQNCAAFTVVGDREHIDGAVWRFDLYFEDFVVDLSEVTVPLDYAILLDDCYRLDFTKMRVKQAAINETTGFTAVFKTLGYCNDVVLNNVDMTGDTNGNTGSGCHALLQHDHGWVIFNDCDLEAANRLIVQGPNACFTVNGGHFERYGVGIDFAPATDPEEPHVAEVRGGIWQQPSDSSRTFRFVGTFENGEKFLIDHPTVETSDRLTRTEIFSIGTFIWNNKNQIDLRGFDWDTWITAPEAKFREACAFWPRSPLNTWELREQEATFLVENVDTGSTNVFTLTEFEALTPFHPVTVEVTAFAAYNGYSLALDRSLWAITQRNTDTATVGTKVTLANAVDSVVGNFSIDSFAVEATAGVDTVTFHIDSVHDDGAGAVTTIADVYVHVKVCGSARITGV